MSKTSYLCFVMLHFECLVCQPNLYCSAIFSAEFCSFCKNSANPNISRKNCSANRILKKIRLRRLVPSTVYQSEFDYEFDYHFWRPIISYVKI